VRVVLENTGSHFAGEIVLWFDDGTGSGPQYSYPVELPSISRKEINLVVYGSSWNSTLRWRLIDRDGKSLFVQKANLYLHSEGDAIYGVIAANPTPFNQLSLLDPASGSASVANIELQDIPNNSRGMESLSILVLCGVDTASMSEDQARALAEWVQYGGTLMICGGPDWQKTVAGLQANAPTSEILPITGLTSISIKTEGPDLASILELLPSDTPPITAGGSELTVIATGSPASNSLVLAADQAGQPLVVMRDIGNGSVIYLGADPSLPPFSTWTGLEPYFRTLLTSSSQQSNNWASGIYQWWGAVTAAETFASLGMPPVLLICGFLFVYMLILGPANFLLLRLINRRELGWVTTPILIIAITLFVFVAGSFTRTGKPILNRLALVQIWPSQSTKPETKIHARVDGVIGIYSPSRATYQIDFANPFVAHAPADVGTGISNLSFSQDGEKYSAKDVRIDVSGIRTLGVEGSIPMENFPYKLTVTLTKNGANLSGYFTNSSPYTFQGAVILASSQSWNLGDVQPGQTVSIDLTINESSSGNGFSDPNTTKPLNPAVVPIAPYGSINPMDAILGTSDYWQSRELYRRYNFLSSFMMDNYYGYGYMQVHGLFLAAWSDDQVIPASVSGRQSDFEDTTLFMIALNPEFESTDSTITLAPGMMNWTALGFSGNPPTPYNMSMYSQGYYAIEFYPAYQLAYSKVQSLVFSIEAMNSSAPPDLEYVTISLYNFVIGDYVPITDLDWGDNEVPNPDQFVGAGGKIRLKVESSLGNLELSRTDFTLILER
jgi:hypothetical protein